MDRVDRNESAGDQTGHTLSPSLALTASTRNVLEAIAGEGHEESFVPVATDEFEPADLPAGSPEKIELFRRRVEMGVPMWHETDRSDDDGRVGAIRPRS